MPPALVRALLAIACATLASGCLAFHTGAMPGEPEDATFATLDGVRVRYVDTGRGSPVVLIHGFASSLETWASVTPALVESGHRVIALDLRGFGWTDRPPGDYSSEAQARLVLALMDQLGVARASVVGHSYGGGVALRLALVAPERVDRIALYDAWAYSGQLPAFFHVARADGIGEAMFATWYGERAEDRMALAFYDQRYVTMELIDAVEASLRRPGTYAAALAAVRAMHYEEVEEQYRTIEHPALLLWGREDRVTPIEIGERLSRELPGARLVVYPGCGHFPMIEHARQSTAELARFLADASAPPVATEPTSGGETPVEAGPIETGTDQTVNEPWWEGPRDAATTSGAPP
jgi:pimeloyl-ACP methyl ester carboxylesterase